MAFIGRIKELKDIKEHLSSDKMEAMLIYGRRRIGKTKLIKEALKDFNGKAITYTFRDIPTQNNIDEFVNYISSSFNEPFISLKTIKEALSYLAEKSKREKIVLFIDEYPFLRRDDNGIDSYFQEIIDQYEDEAKLKIIFCGSYIEIMKKMINQNSPLYGRFSYIVQLHPFDYYDSSLFMSNLSNEEKFKYYAVFGGIAFTLVNINFNKSFNENLEELLLNIDSLFEREIQSILNQEISKIPEVKLLFELISKGKHKYSDINTVFSQSKITKNVSYFLNKLIELDLIQKSSIVNEKNIKSEQYYIKDNLLDFYYTYCFSNINQREIMSGKDFFNIIQDDFEKKFLPRKFEEVSKEFLIKSNKLGLINPKINEIGRYSFHNKDNNINGEIDLLAKSENEIYDYECKYYNRKLNFNDYVKEQNTLSKLGLENIKIGLISKLGFEDDLKNIKKFSLNDFYKIPNMTESKKS